MYRLQEIMQMFDVPERTIRRHLKLGILTGTKVGGSWRFNDSDIENYLNQTVIRTSHSKNAMNKVYDFMNGISPFSNFTMISLNFSQLSKLQMEQLTNFVNALDKAFYFNVSPHSNTQNVVFIGENEDVIAFLNMAKERI